MPSSQEHVSSQSEKWADQVSLVPMDRRSVSVLATGHLCIDLCQGAVPALLPFLIVERHLSYAAAASFILASSLASSIIQPIFGKMADRSAVPWLMPVGLLIAGGGLIGASQATNFWLIICSMICSGIGIALFHPEAARWINLVSGQRRATAMSIFSVGGNLGFAIGPLLTTSLLLAFGMWGVSLLLLPLAAISLVLLLTFPRLLSFYKRQASYNTLAVSAEKNAWGAFSILTAAIICRSIVF